MTEQNDQRCRQSRVGIVQILRCREHAVAKSDTIKVINGHLPRKNAMFMFIMAIQWFHPWYRLTVVAFTYFNTVLAKPRLHQYNRLSNPLSNRLKGTAIPSTLLYERLFVQHGCIVYTQTFNPLSNPYDNRFDRRLYRVYSRLLNRLYNPV